VLAGPDQQNYCSESQKYEVASELEDRESSVLRVMDLRVVEEIPNDSFSPLLPFAICIDAMDRKQSLFHFITQPFTSVSPHEPKW
jgi:hypothetical protein